jgi:hypothetical protein
LCRSDNGGGSGRVDNRGISRSVRRGIDIRNGIRRVSNGSRRVDYMSGSIIGSRRNVLWGAAEELSIEATVAAVGSTEVWLLAVAVSVAAGTEEVAKVAEVGGGRALVAVVVTESVTQVAVEEESTTEASAEESTTEVSAEKSTTGAATEEAAEKSLPLLPLLHLLILGRLLLCLLPLRLLLSTTFKLPTLPTGNVLMKFANVTSMVNSSAVTSVIRQQNDRCCGFCISGNEGSSGGVDNRGISSSGRRGINIRIGIRRIDNRNGSRRVDYMSGSISGSRRNDLWNGSRGIIYRSDSSVCWQHRSLTVGCSRLSSSRCGRGKCICSTLFQRKNWYTFHGNFMQKLAEVGGGRAHVAVVVTESVTQVAVKEKSTTEASAEESTIEVSAEKSTTGAATEEIAEESITEVTAEELTIVASFIERFPVVGLGAWLDLM